MTVNEVRERIIKGECLSDMFKFKDGQECLIYKGEWNPGDEVIYIPDIDLNEICINRPLIKILNSEEVMDVLSYLYTGKDFMELADGDEDFAKRLFDYVDWQHPSSALDEVIDGEDEDSGEQSGGIDMNLNNTTLCMDNAIEITWIYEELASEHKIVYFGNRNTRDYVKETIIDIAKDFEKEYKDADWNELDYLDCLQKYAELRLIKKFN